jgi:alpha-D-ribose 1-methylphosphonate 5-triphosphate diphosphatase PhnM
MAAKSGAADGFAPVLTALATMQSNAAGKEKSVAHEFLEAFQKSVRSQEVRAGHTQHTYFTVVGSVEYYTCHLTRFIGSGRGQIICSDNFEGKGQRICKPRQSPVADCCRLHTICINSHQMPLHHCEIRSCLFSNSISLARDQFERNYAYALRVWRSS